MAIFHPTIRTAGPESGGFFMPAGEGGFAPFAGSTPVHFTEKKIARKLVRTSLIVTFIESIIRGTMAQKRYLQIYGTMKERIQQGVYGVGSYLPSENELCNIYGMTRTTIRRALDELQREGFIVREHGRGSRVLERRQALGLLAVKGFSEAVGQDVRTRFLQTPVIGPWPSSLPWMPDEKERGAAAIFFERLRGVGTDPVMLESNWFSSDGLETILNTPFEEDSFFKTLSSRYLIEVTGSEQELRALHAEDKTAGLLKIKPGEPILHISIRFSTSRPRFFIYSILKCNTAKYPIGNVYKHPI